MPHLARTSPHARSASAQSRRLSLRDAALVLGGRELALSYAGGMLRARWATADGVELRAEGTTEEELARAVALAQIDSHGA